MVMRSGGMCPTARIGRKAIFSVRTPRIQPAAIARTSATGQGKSPHRHGEVAHEGAEHVHLAVGEGDEVHGPEDDDEPDGHQGVEAPLGETIHDLL